MRFSLSLALCLAVPLGAWAQPYTAVEAFPFDVFGPVELVVAPGQPDRIYLVEQGTVGPNFRARVQTFRVGETAATTFLDLGSRVRRGGESGFLGMAFHPDYASNGRVFVSYSADNPLRSVISEFSRSSSDPLMADAASEQVLLEVPQPDDNHNGGQITFGPDGFLYIGFGDGGGSNDQHGNGQNTTTLLGAMLRIDVDTVPDGETYGIPDTNPFAATDGPDRDEIYAYGFRNPWRFAFDGETGHLWVMDVGQGEWEEISRVENGENHGWNVVEGPECFQSGCTVSDFESPVFAYGHDAGGGFSISGGMVYRGAAIPSLQGQVLYADYVSRRVWALDASGSEPDTTLLLTVSGAGISAIREGPGGEPYILAHSDRATRVLRLEGVPVSEEDGPFVASPTLQLSGPNPFSQATEVMARLPEGGPARVVVYDALGRELTTLYEGELVAGVAKPIPVAGSTWPPGVFVVRLMSGEVVVSVQTLVRIR